MANRMRYVGLRMLAEGLYGHSEILATDPSFDVASEHNKPEAFTVGSVEIRSTTWLY